MTSTKIDFSGASDFDISGGNFGKVEGDIKTIISSKPYRNRRWRRRSSRTSSALTSRLARVSPASSVSSLGTPADESETSNESDYTSPPSSVDQHQSQPDSFTSSPHQPIPPPPQETHASTTPRARTTESHRVRRASLSQYSSRSFGSSRSFRTQPGSSPFSRPANPEPFQGPGVPPLSSTHSGGSNDTPSAWSNHSTPRNVSCSLQSVPPATPTDIPSTPRSGVPAFLGGPGRGRSRYSDIHSRPLPPLPTASQSCSPGPALQPLDDASPRVGAVSADAPPFVYPSPTPSSGLEPPSHMSTSGGGSLHPIADQRHTTMPLGGPLHYSPSPAAPAMVYSPHRSADSGHYYHDRFPSRIGSHAVVPNTAAPPTTVPPPTTVLPMNPCMYYHHQIQVQVQGMQPYPRMPFSVPPFSGYGIPLNYMPWMGGGPAYGPANGGRC